MSHSTVLIAAASLVLAVDMVSAAEPAAVPLSGSVRRLSTEEAEAVQEAAAKRNINVPAVDDRPVPDGRIHGEIGFGVGTGGYSSVFGTAIVPLGDNGIAAFSFERTNFGRRRYRY